MAPPSDDALTVKVRAVIARELDVPESEALDSASLTEDLGADSLDLVELMMALEEAFDAQISDEQARTIRTVGDAVRFVRELAAASSAGQPDAGAPDSVGEGRDDGPEPEPEPEPDPAPADPEAS